VRRQFQLAPNQSNDLGVGGGGWATRIDQGNALRFAARNLEVCIPDPGKKSTALLLKTILIAFTALISGGPAYVTAARTINAGGEIRVHENCQLRLQIAAQDAVKREYWPGAELASATLIRLRGVSEPVTQDEFSFTQSGLNYFFNVLRARGEHQGKLGRGRQMGGASVEDDLANLLARVSATRLTGHYYRKAIGAEHFGQPLELGALATAVETFNGDEFAAWRVRAHGGDHNKALPVL
jgi:hypothetical protein